MTGNQAAILLSGRSFTATGRGLCVHGYRACPFLPGVYQVSGCRQGGVSSSLITSAFGTAAATGKWRWPMCPLQGTIQGLLALPTALTGMVAQPGPVPWEQPP